jgi:predicted lipid carrier protein YhbT
MVNFSFRTALAHQLPNLIGQPIKLVPYGIQKKVLTKILRGVFEESITAGEMDFLEGNYIKFDISDCYLSCNMTLKNKFLVLSNQSQFDANVRCKLADFILLANRKVDPDTLFFQRRLVIEGNTELGLSMKNLMDSLDPDLLPAPLLKGFTVMEYLLAP